MSSPPPDPGKRRGLGLNPGRQQTKETSDHLLDYSNFGNRDYWIHLYLDFLDREIRRLNAGPIGRHYWRCAAGAYADFRAGNQASRWRAWLAIRTTCQWLSQLEGAQP